MPDLFRSQDRAQRHKAIRERIAELASSIDYEIPTEDLTVTVDLAELHAKCGDMEGWLRQLVSTPNSV